MGGGGEFDEPLGIAVDAAGNVYVSDTRNDRIRKFTSTGEFLTGWGSPGSGPGEFRLPTGIAADRQGNVYVADNLNHRVQKFTSEGAFVSTWSIGGPFYLATDTASNVYITVNAGHTALKFSSEGVLLTQWGSPGEGPGQFLYPTGITVDPSGNIFVAEPNEFRERGSLARIQKFGQAPTSASPSTWGSLKTRYR